MSTDVQFDVNGARQAGYSDDEILQHLTQTRKFDVQGALKAGYSQQEIINHLSGSQDSNATPEAMNDNFRAQGLPEIKMPAAPVPDELKNPRTASQAYGEQLGEQIKAPARILAEFPEKVSELIRGVKQGKKPERTSAESLVSAAKQMNPVPPARPGEGMSQRVAGTLGNLTPMLVGGAEALANRGSAVPEGSPLDVKTANARTEALTATMDKVNLGSGDIHEEVSQPAVPLLRQQAARMGIRPTQFEGRAGNKLAVEIADQAWKAKSAQGAAITKPYFDQPVSQKPIAEAYRSMITNELKNNEPQVANRLEAEAKKFDGQASLKDVNDFRVRMNKELTAYEAKPEGKQIASDVELRAQRKAADAARSIQYSTVGQLSGVGEDYARQLAQDEGVLIEARNSIASRVNKMSAQQAEVASRPPITSSEGLRERIAGTRPTRPGVEHHILREMFGVKPVDTLNSRFKTVFGDLPQFNTPTDVMMAAKNGDITPADAARLTQKMRGKAGTITRPIVPPIPMRRAGNDR